MSGSLLNSSTGSLLGQKAVLHLSLSTQCINAGGNLTID